MDNKTPNYDASAPTRLWPNFTLGILLFVLGPVIYYGQMSWSLAVPWYLPVLSTVGVLLMLVSIRQHGVVWRKIVCLLFLVLSGLQWFFFVELTRTQPYSGPAQVGAKIAGFKASYADGRPFTNADIESDQRTVLLFYRGRW